MRADVVVHADWSATPAGRWAAVATRRRDGRYQACAPHHVGDASDPLAALAGSADAVTGTVLVGLDAVLGLPRAYARRAGVTSFPALLPALGRGRWSRFFDVAEQPGEIELHRPFYPQRPRNASKAALATALGLQADELLRRCDRPTPHRRGGCELFWTVGGQQVGKASLAAWRGVVRPLRRRRGEQLRLWPFDGGLHELLAAGGVVVCETYPAEAAVHIGLRSTAGSKRDPVVRRGHAGALLQHAARLGIELSTELRAAVTGGFEWRGGGHAFDAVVGLLAMLGVVLGDRPPGAPANDPAVRSVEGWMLGLDPTDLATPDAAPAPPRGARCVVARNPDCRSRLP